MGNDEDHIRKIGAVLNDENQQLSERFRALFTLKNLGETAAVECIGQSFSDSSALLKHESAYCLGQMQNKEAIPILTSVLRDVGQETIVRHEAGEALGAIGSPDCLDVLKEYEADSIQEIAETCQLAIQRIQWLRSEDRTLEESKLKANPFSSVDPAPPAVETGVEELRKTLVDPSRSLFERYRAMFALRNRNDEESVIALADGLKCTDSALFRHEIAYVLGQMQHEASIPHLQAQLAMATEDPMVRHECAEALGSVAGPRSSEMLQGYLEDKERVVRESCIIALDMCEHENSEEFQYANTLKKLEAETKTAPKQIEL
ncbi:deoxyhypusine hydroxylase-like [Diadema antillarum]|uniref:deoxyhypusine hydroxylase-like n=1 Tax=Diadema antillarum TaxID=105358 RepID=UPI003A88EB61